ncbi:MAG: T9SS type A sorting domain-containing protein [Bacteroidota bacterium]
MQYQSTTTGITDFTPQMLHSSGFPNPATDHIMLYLDHPVNGDAELNIYDMQGKMVMQLHTAMTTSDRFEWMFPITELSNGIYTVKITCADKIWQQKISKQ